MERVMVGVPDWSKAPEWAEYWAVDGDGSVFWYSDEPILFPSGIFWSSKGRIESSDISVSPVCIKRPSSAGSQDRGDNGEPGNTGVSEVGGVRWLALLQGTIEDLGFATREDAESYVLDNYTNGEKLVIFKMDPVKTVRVTTKTVLEGVD